MLIKTQTKLCVVVLEKMDVIKIVEREGKIFIVAECGNTSYDLGQYSSISKAKKLKSLSWMILKEATKSLSKN